MLYVVLPYLAHGSIFISAWINNIPVTFAYGHVF